MKLFRSSAHSLESTFSPTMMTGPAQHGRDEKVLDANSQSSIPRDAAEAFTLHGDFVWRTLQRMGVRDADLEDAMQEVFIVVGRQLGTFEGHSKMTTWLYGISLRVASTHRRRAWVRRELPTAEMPEGPSTEALPDESLHRARERQRLHEILELMSPPKRALLVMFELDEMTCDEIASVFEIPIGTVHSRLHTARQEFKNALQRWTARHRKEERFT